MHVHPVRIVGATGTLDPAELHAPLARLERIELPWPTLATTTLMPAVDDALERLMDVFEDHGYLHAHGSSEVRPSADRRWVDVTLTVAAGERVKLGSIDVRDPDGSPLEPAASRALFPIADGAWYSKRTISEGTSALLDRYAARKLGAHAWPTKNEHDGAVDVVIEVTRRPAIDRVATFDLRGVDASRAKALVARFGLAVGDRVDRWKVDRGREALLAADDELVSVSARAVELEGRPGENVVKIDVIERVPMPP
jgi:outer membrane protein assembly factor BamA